MNKKIMSLIIIGTIIVCISIIGYCKIENQENNKVKLTEDNKKTLDDIKVMIENNKIVTPRDMKSVAEKEFGKGEKSDYLYKDESSGTGIEYSLTESQDIAFNDKEKNLENLLNKEQELEKKRVEFMILFHKAYRNYVDSTIESGLTKENFKNVGEVYSEWLDILYMNRNIDPISLEGVIVYTYCIDTIAFDGYNMKRIRDILLSNRYDKEKYSVESTIKIMNEHRERYDIEISRYYNYIREFEIK